MKQQLTKLDILWIRACKSKEPEKRLVSLYRRFYHSKLNLKYPSHPIVYIVPILLELCDSYFPMKLVTLLEREVVYSEKHGCKQPFYLTLFFFETGIWHIGHQVNLVTLQQTTNFIPPKRFR